MQTRIRVGGIWLSGHAVLLESLVNGTGWLVPGGGVEADESLRDACEREYREETGIEVECTSLAIASEFFWDDRGTPAREYGFFFLVSPRQPISEPAPSIRSLVPGVEFRWFDLDELADLALVPRFLKRVLPNLGSGVVFVEDCEYSPHPE